MVWATHTCCHFLPILPLHPLATHPSRQQSPLPQNCGQGPSVPQRFQHSWPIGSERVLSMTSLTTSAPIFLLWQLPWRTSDGFRGSGQPLRLVINSWYSNQSKKFSQIVQVFSEIRLSFFNWSIIWQLQRRLIWKMIVKCLEPLLWDELWKGSLFLEFNIH